MGTCYPPVYQVAHAWAPTNEARLLIVAVKESGLRCRHPPSTTTEELPVPCTFSTIRPIESSAISEVLLEARLPQLCMGLLVIPPNISEVRASMWRCRIVSCVNASLLYVLAAGD